jgi:homocitrate synthase
VKAVREVLSPSTGIEFHTHNDTGCCIANAYIAVENGATHVDTCVLGIGERNGITPLGGFLGRLYTVDKDHIKTRFDLPVLRHLERFVAQTCGIRIPFNNYITGSSAFTHKAGVHSKAVMANPNAYEVIDPADFGIERQIQFAHRLTGWNAIFGRSKQLGLDLTDDQVKAATSLIKNLADEQEVTLEEVDAVLYHLAASPRTSSSIFKQFLVDQKSDVPAELRAAAEQAATAIAQFEHANAFAAVKAIRAKVAIDNRPMVYYKASGHLFDTRAFNQLLDAIVDSPCQFEIVDLQIPHENQLPSLAYIKVWSDKNNAHDIASLGEQIQVIAAKYEGVKVAEIEKDSVPKTSKK